MTISEQSRHAMYVQLESVLGQEAALILMEHLPPVGWADVATKRDLDQLRREIKSDFDQHRAATKGGFDQLHALVQRDLAELRGDLRGEMVAQTRTMVFALVAALVSVSGLTLTATQIS